MAVVSRVSRRLRSLGLGIRPKIHRASALTAIIDFNVSNDDESRQRADERARAAYRQLASAEAKSLGLKELQADAQAARQLIADWVKIVSDAPLDERR